MSTHAEDNQSDKNAGAENESDSDADKKTEDNNAADKKAEETELDPLEKAQKEVEDLKKQLLYKTAEFENYRKRTLKEKAELVLNGADKDFDVDFHEAIAMVPGMGDDKKGKVIDCVQTGYTLNDKVIRHAKVAVGQ